VRAGGVTVPAVDGAGSQRARLAIALGAALVLGAIVIAVVALGGGDDEESVVAAAPACIRAWNGDPAATAYGRHNFDFHRYTGALVTFLTPQGSVVGEGEGGRCAVIFPSKVLDPEPFAAGQVLHGESWQPISELAGIELTRVGELQADAAQGPNTILDTEGELTAR
jgi:hypothetical protein